jgi:hypothetical protein
MSHPLVDLAARFRFNESLINMVTDKFDAEDWAAAPETGGNNPIWILGHITTSRRCLLRQLRIEVPEESWERFFGMGSQLKDPGAYPSPASLDEHFRNAGAALTKRLGNLTIDEADAPMGTTFPDGSNTIGKGAHFLYFHEVYHLGQIGLLRRMRGKPGFA